MAKTGDINERRTDLGRGPAWWFALVDARGSVRGILCYGTLEEARQAKGLVDRALRNVSEEAWADADHVGSQGLVTPTSRATPPASPMQH